MGTALVILAGALITVAAALEEMSEMGKKGFRKEPTHYKLIFEEHPDLKGFEVTMRALSLGKFLDINRLALTVDNADTQERVQQADLLFRRFSESLVEWNLEDDDGAPIPADYDGVKTQELPFIQTIIGEWMEAMSGIPKNSNSASNGSGTSLERSIPMEAP